MKFSIRDLLLVTVIVALVLGWAFDHWRQGQILGQERSERFWDRRRIETLEQELKEAGIPFPKKD